MCTHTQLLPIQLKYHTRTATNANTHTDAHTNPALAPSHPQQTCIFATQEYGHPSVRLCTTGRMDLETRAMVSGQLVLWVRITSWHAFRRGKPKQKESKHCISFSQNHQNSKHNGTVSVCLCRRKHRTQLRRTAARHPRLWLQIFGTICTHTRIHVG